MINVDQPRNRAIRATGGSLPVYRLTAVTVTHRYDAGNLRSRIESALTSWINPLTMGATLILTAIVAYFTSATIHAEVGTAASVLSGGNGSEIGDYLRSFGAWGPIVSLSLMLLQAVIAPIPGSLIGLANGLAYGTFWGGVLTLGGQTLAATACFSIARHLGRTRIESISEKAAGVAGSGWLARWGAAGIIVTRLVPGLSFDLISFAAGLTRMGFGRFLIATIIGSAPQAFLASYLVQKSPTLGWAFMGVSVLAMGAIAVYALIRNRRANAR